ncbi:MAG: ABC transporter ATP-binding protein [Myxococcales bacterium]|nr:ABC transporter ATP-binding protein [Myxococcales bacterium]MCB9703796.1 ABC transporter ATP-binding protein [Myxococcales bacterium]
MRPLVLARDLHLRYPSGVVALAGVDLEVTRGELVALVGPSGCGKSTLLRAIAGLVPFTGGTLEIAGKSPLDARRERQGDAFVFQDPSLLPWRRVADNVGLPLELLGRPPAERAPAVAQALAQVGLADAARAYPDELSGGMKMRASLARALVTRPELLLLDEPFGALDELGRRRLNDTLVALWERDRWTGLMITHSLLEAVTLATRVIVMGESPGRIVASLAIDLPRPRPLDGPEGPAILAHVAALERHLGSAEAPR